MRVRIPFVVATLAAWVIIASPVSASAAAWLWDQNQNRIDDRIEAVQTQGLSAAYVNHDLNGRQILFVYPDANPLTYGVYVGFDHMPTDADVSALQGTGATLLWRPRYIPYLRARATFAQVQLLASVLGVTRVEAWQVMYATNDIATRTLRARETTGGAAKSLFPSVWTDLGLTGKGIVIGILDTGVNDVAMGAYPGHESLDGRFVGGGDFEFPDASLNTPPDGSANPANNVDPEGAYHATHVAGIALGSGGPNGVLAGAAPGFYAGMAPEARLVDCKVLTDAGRGGGSAEALEWCIAHKDSIWNVPGEPGFVYRGVQVVNMSLGGSSASDGTDADAAAVNAAVKAGIVVCISTGNDGKTAYMPSPAAADLDIAVGSFQDGNTVARGDDIVSDFSNEGPRTADADADHLDEMKPSVCGSGSDIVSALGDPTTDGRHYHNINGTSMSCPTIAGLCALILQANPRLTPLEVRDILQNTSDHRRDHGQQPPSAADPYGLDPNYHPSWGWGQPDAYAAAKEALNNNLTQVISEGTTSIANVGGHLEVAIRFVTQREVSVTHFDVWRAPEVQGGAGAFAHVSPAITPAGHPDIERVTNRTPYNWTDTDASLVPGTPYWYQVRWTDELGREHREPAFRVDTAVPPVRARVRWVVTHQALDNDAVIRFGSGTNPNAPVFVRGAGGRPAADSSKSIAPGFGDGVVRYFFHSDLTDADEVSGFLPPSSSNPWFLSLLEEGFVNTEGVVDSFAVTVYNGPTATTYVSPNPSAPTIERQTTVMWIPLDPATSPNHAPVLATIGNRSVSEGLPIHFTATATDPDGQALTYSATGLPSGASFDPGTRTFSWTPSYGQAGSYVATFKVQDSFVIPAVDSERVTITVLTRAPGSNTAPILSPIPDQSVRVENRLTFAVTARDQEDETLTYSATDLPSGASFDPATRLFGWTPFYGDEDHAFRVVFHAADPAGAADSQAVLIFVSPAGPTPLANECSADSTALVDSIGADVQGTLIVTKEHPFTIGAGVAFVRGTLLWTGGPAIDLDLYLLDDAGNVVASGATATSDPEVATYINPVPGQYRWQVVSFDNPNPNENYRVVSTTCTRTSVGVAPPAGPVSFALAQNMPNPFRRSSIIHFALPSASPVSLRIYDVAGRSVRTLVNGPLEAGVHQRVWDGRDDQGSLSQPGVYFYRLEAGVGSRTKRMVFLR